MHLTRTSPSEDYTAALGRALATLLRPGDILALRGQLGAGKTTLVRAIAQGLRIDAGLVSSPTFVLVNQYPIPKTAPTLAGGQLVHVDAYRLHGSEDLDTLGWDQFIDESGRARGNRAVIIEWAERINDSLPADAARINLTASGRTAREIALDLPDSWQSREGFELFRDREPTQCRASGQWVEPTAKTYPFANDIARDADLYQWFTSGYKTSRAPGSEDSPRMDTDEDG